MLLLIEGDAKQADPRRCALRLLIVCELATPRVRASEMIELSTQHLSCCIHQWYAALHP